MPKFYLLLWAAFFSAQTQAMSSQTFAENADVAVSLSQVNYNRLVVKNDKITKAHFPEGAMAVKGEEDGSLYVMVAQTEPFTLFLTTEGGHHFSTTITSENTLGKTVEFVPTVLKESPKTPHAIPVGVQHAAMFSTLMSHMMNHKTLPGYQVKRHFGRAIRLQQHLVLLPKQTYQGLEFSGEALEIYNGGSLPIDLSESWFTAPNVLAVSLSVPTLVPKQRAMVYRVVEHRHG